MLFVAWPWCPATKVQLALEDCGKAGGHRWASAKPALVSSGYIIGAKFHGGYVSEFLSEWSGSFYLHVCPGEEDVLQLSKVTW